MCEVFWQYVNKVSNTVRERLRIGILVSGSVKARRDLRPPSCWKWWGWSPGGLSDLFKVTHRASKAQGVRPGSPGSQSCSLLGLQFCCWLYAFLCFSQNETQIVKAARGFRDHLTQLWGIENLMEKYFFLWIWTWGYEDQEFLTATRTLEMKPTHKKSVDPREREKVSTNESVLLSLWSYVRNQYQKIFENNHSGSRWQSRRLCAHLLLQEHQNHN